MPGVRGRAGLARRGDPRSDPFQQLRRDDVADRAPGPAGCLHPERHMLDFHRPPDKQYESHHEKQEKSGALRL
jgi:hypothetical protein